MVTGLGPCPFCSIFPWNRIWRCVGRSVLLGIDSDVRDYRGRTLPQSDNAGREERESLWWGNAECSGPVPWGAKPRKTARGSQTEGALRIYSTERSGPPGKAPRGSGWAPRKWAGNRWWREGWRGGLPARLHPPGGGLRPGCGVGVPATGGGWGPSPVSQRRRNSTNGALSRDAAPRAGAPGLLQAAESRPARKGLLPLASGRTALRDIA